VSRNLLDYAMRLLARRAYSSEELRRRLSRRSDDPAEIQAVLNRLTDLQLLDDRSFSQQRAIRRRTVDFWGKRRIQLELRQLGLDARMIRLALHQAEQELPESEALARAVERWLRLHGEPSRLRALKRLYEYCLRLGYPAETVREKLAPWFRDVAE